VHGVVFAFFVGAPAAAGTKGSPPMARSGKIRPIDIWSAISHFGPAPGGILIDAFFGAGGSAQRRFQGKAYYGRDQCFGF
jgi:hypothetical protein